MSAGRWGRTVFHNSEVANGDLRCSGVVGPCSPVTVERGEQVGSGRGKDTPRVWREGGHEISILRHQALYSLKNKKA